MINFSRAEDAAISARITVHDLDWPQGMSAHALRRRRGRCNRTMCGITGYFDLAGSDPIECARLHAMNDAIAHRGPDGDGFHLEPGVGLAMRRLAIIDVAGGQQPIYNEDRSVAIVYNGEIYNYQELTTELVARGHCFKTHSDTEAVVHAW